ncbi:MAG TPA: PfkB family carbohydrate kinase [Stellaceae bacterium]|nr:PfkB family carbohydrate kinase [Stellaceae bacterium]
MGNDSEFVAVLQQLKSAHVLCLGDVLLEVCADGSLLPAAAEGAPVLAVAQEMRQVGGAGRVLRDLAALGAPTTFVSVVGNDDAGREIERLLAAEAGAEIHLLVQPDRTTARRSRFAAAGSTLLRVDRESPMALGPYIREDLLRLARELVTTHGAVVISDHGKGVVTEGVALEVIRAARDAGARSIVDAQGGDPIRYRGADLLTVTQSELAQATGMPVAEAAAIEAAAGALIDRCGVGAVLVSLDGGGAMVVESGGGAHREAIADDAGVAIIAAALGAGLPARTALRLATAAGLIGGADVAG